MRTYLEILERFTNADGITETGQSVKMECADRADALAKLAIYEPSFAGKAYVKRIHTCNHDEAGRETGCTEEVL